MERPEKAKTLFITATDTGAGKTFFTLALARALSSLGLSVAVYKPIQTGCKPNNSLSSLGSEDLELILEHCSKDFPELGVKCSYCLSLPATPELAAKEDRVEINLQKLQNDFEDLCAKYDVVLVEGAGGLIVPIAQNFVMADLISSFGCDALLVVQNKLGCINQACLSAHYAKSKGINLKGFVLNNISNSEKENPKVLANNAVFIQEYAKISCLAELPFSLEESLEADNAKNLEQIILGFK
ncbi:MAG: dethiobiotin synthase [Candidatus Caenarcaniphilales bacterium]|nr:dethiobiotin synthase [Candidatus Caenarcaniphilales bacterium]